MAGSAQLAHTAQECKAWDSDMHRLPPGGKGRWRWQSPRESAAAAGRSTLGLRQRLRLRSMRQYQH